MTTNDHEFGSTSDPFTALSATAMPGWDDPVAPDVEFARTLRDRLERGATLPRGVLMSTTQITAIGTEDAAIQPDLSDVVPRPGALPYLTVADAAAAIDWYVANLGARLIGEPIVMDDGRIGHAELELGGGTIYLATEFPEAGLVGPAPDKVSVSLMVPVPDTDAALETARSGGAAVQREPYEGYGTRGATIIDPFGHRWMLTGPSKEATMARMRHGDIGYLSVNTPDADRTRTFFGAVLGWRYDNDGRQVTNVDSHLGIFQTPGSGTAFCGYAVDDIDDARRRIERAGGLIVEGPYVRDGRPTLDAVDDAGVRFAVFVPKPEDARPQQHPLGIGDMSYLTVHTADSARFRRFYGEVLGWEYTPGRMADGWEVSGSHPQVGIAGGADSEVAVPMWNVADIAAAVERVRAAGGRVITEPDPQPYGIMSLCADDQGAEFYLGQLT